MRYVIRISRPSTPTPELIECSIAGEELWAFRIRGLKTNLRALGVTLPMLFVIGALCDDDAGMALLFLAPIVIAPASAYGAWRWRRELKRPGLERFIVDGGSVVREVGGVVKARLQNAHVRAAFRTRNSLILRGHVTIEIPSTSDGFPSVVETLSKRFDIQTDASVFSLFRFGVALFTFLVTMTFCVVASYSWIWATAASGIGLLLVELTWRVITAQAPSRPTTF